MLDKILYRTWQVWKNLTGRLSSQDWKEVESVLSPEQARLFRRMSEAEQAHSVRVYRALKGKGFQDPDLLAAALLHDVGKTHIPLKLWERVWIVLAPSLTPRHSGLSKGTSNSFQRALWVSEKHPEWGADMALSAGVSSTTAWLIRNHERESMEEDSSTRFRLLKALIEADNES